MALTLAIGLGVAAGVALGSRTRTPDATAARVPAPPTAARVDPALLARAEALHDEARALTRAEVTLDERASERWMPRVAKIEQALDDPATPGPIRTELQGTIRALECVGLLGAPEPSCVTIER